MKILVPTDFSEQASFALDFAAGLARLNGATISLLHIVEYSASSNFDMTGISQIDNLDNVYLMQILDASKERMQKLLESPAYQGIVIEADVRIGNPFSGITDEIMDKAVDMVVMGSKGSEGFAELLIGSNTEKVVRNAHCPVITLKSPTAVNEIKSIAFATDMKDDPAPALAHLKEIQSLLQAHIQIFKVITSDNKKNNPRDIEHLQEFAKINRMENYSVHVAHDKVEEDGIMYFAEKQSAGMIALCTHGRSGFLQLFSASVAEDLVNHAKRPVWTFRLPE